MSHTEVNYNDPDPAKNQTKAMNDLRSFIGRGQSFEKFLVIATTGILQGYNMTQFRLMCSFAGVEGYPVEALAKYITNITGVDMPAEEESNAN